MVINRDFDIVKKTGLLFFLLLVSMSAQAQASDAVVNTVEKQAAEAVDTSAGDNKPGEDRTSENHQQGFSFPKWPESRSVKRERVPMAPPGPYMSSALSDFSFREPAYDRDLDRVGSRSAIDVDQADSSMEQFSPDMPWPSHANSPARWQPENGYSYVEPSRINRNPYQAMPNNSSSNYNSGYRRSSVMSWPAREPARSRPEMNNPAY